MLIMVRFKNQKMKETRRRQTVRQKSKEPDTHYGKTILYILIPVTFHNLFIKTI